MIAGLGAGGTLLAAEPAAIIEEATAVEADVQVFDYLEPGQIVNLGQSGQLVLGYLQSCLRETVEGGRITVGVRESDVVDGFVVREAVLCDPAYTTVADDAAGESGVLVFRAPLDAGQDQPLRIYSATPVFAALQPMELLVIERIDQGTERIELKPEGPSLDLADSEHHLALGGTYRAVSGDRTQHFLIDPSARWTGGPLVSRLIRF